MTRCTRCGRPVERSKPVMISAMAAGPDGILVGPSLPYGPSCARRMLGNRPRRLAARPRPLDADPVEVLPDQLELPLEGIDE